MEKLTSPLFKVYLYTYVALRWSSIFFIFLNLLICCKPKNENRDDIKKVQLFHPEYQKNDILLDKINDKRLMRIDTILYFSDIKMLYKLTLKKSKVNIKTYKWEEAADSKITFEENGFIDNGFIYIRDNIENDKYSIGYKILLNKGLFFWNGIHWELINSGEY